MISDTDNAKMKLSTVRCTITKLQTYDFEEAVDLFTNKDVRRYLGGTVDKNLALEKLHFWIQDKNSMYLAVRMTGTQTFVGIISITDHHDGVFKELSYQYLPEFWNSGIATETLGAILEYLKNNSEIIELIAETQSKNTRSCRLLEKLGFGLDDTVHRFGELQNIYKIIL